MIATSTYGNATFSAEVCLMLELEGNIHSLSTVEPDRFVLAQQQLLTDGDAVLVVTVNGEPRRTPIRVVASPAPAREFAYTVR